MTAEDEFDDFYLPSRRRILLDVFAYVGDRHLAADATRAAFTQAAQHWQKLRGNPWREAWVRERAWSWATRWQWLPRRRYGELTEQQSALTVALHKLKPAQRKAIILSFLTAVEPEQLAREVNLPVTAAEQTLALASARLAHLLKVSEAELPSQLGTLVDAVVDLHLPRPAVMTRRGRRRGRRQAVGGTVAALAMVVGAGAVVTDTGPTFVDPGLEPSMLLPAGEIAAMAGNSRWQVVGTDDNTSGTGINSVCQTTRFADPAGLDALVRRFVTPGNNPRGFVQTVEVSANASSGQDAYRAIIDWYGTCKVARIQLLDAWQVSGVGDEATVLRLRIPDRKQSRAFVVGVARTGAVTTATVVERSGIKPGRVVNTAAALGSAVNRLCVLDLAGPCAEQPDIHATRLPPNGSHAGLLGIADLPPVGDIPYPWVGSEPVHDTNNVAATTCDPETFTNLPNSSTITYLIPQANLPRRFGLSQTIVTVASEEAALAEYQRIQRRMRTCPERNLASTVTNFRHRESSIDGWSMWRLVNEVEGNFEVGAPVEVVKFWTGVARVGTALAQVTFAGAPDQDLNADDFEDLITRARDRLYEIE